LPRDSKKTVELNKKKRHPKRCVDKNPRRMDKKRTRRDMNIQLETEGSKTFSILFSILKYHEKSDLTEDTLILLPVIFGFEKASRIEIYILLLQNV
jgi:predicted metal-dependent peptidase